MQNSLCFEKLKKKNMNRLSDHQAKRVNFFEIPTLNPNPPPTLIYLKSKEKKKEKQNTDNSIHLFLFLAFFKCNYNYNKIQRL